jgi:lysozyme
MAVPKAFIGTGVATALALALTTPIVSKWEGKENDPYKDIVGVSTVCYGETRVEMRRYSDKECVVMLETALKDFQKEVLKRSPELANKPYQLAAATSLAYNIGINAYDKSTARKRFKAGDLRGGCEALKFWVYAKGKRVKGLVNRRADEYRLCMSDV